MEGGARKWTAICLALLTGLIVLVTQAQGQGQEGSSSAPPECAAVVVNGKRLFVYSSIHLGRPPIVRAEETAQRIREVIDKPGFDPDSIKIVETPAGTEVVAGQEVIATITIADARTAQSTTPILAGEVAGKVKALAAKKAREGTPTTLAFAIATCVIATIAFLVFAALTTRMTAAICARIALWRGTKLQSIKIQQAELLSADTLAQLLLSTTKIGSILVIILLFGAYVLIALGSFPATRPIAETLIYNSMTPISTLGESVLGYVPSGISIAFIALVTYAVMAFARFFFDSVEAQTIHIADFDPEWAAPTYKLLRLLIIAFAMVAALPYMPGWQSESFKQVGFFIGILFSLGSTSVVGNVMAGTVLTYTNAFKVGDRIKVGECIGDVVEKTLFVTRICTPKNEIISLPNASILNANITNYSSHAKHGKLILYTTVSIGYSADWRKVHKLLMDAAEATEDIVADPEPFVLQTALNDFYVSYQLNAFTDQANKMPSIYSALHQNIQDKFNQGGIEIMSPHYSSLRDGNESTIPKDHLPKDYKSPHFNISA